MQRWRVQEAVRVLAAVGAEGSVAGAEQQRQVNDGELDQRHKLWPIVAAFVDEGTQHISDDSVDALNLAG